MAPMIDNGRVDVLIERVSNLLNRMDTWERRQDELEHCQQDQDTRLTRVEERQGVLAGALGTFTLIASAISAYIGSILK